MCLRAEQAPASNRKRRTVCEATAAKDGRYIATLPRNYGQATATTGPANQLIERQVCCQAFEILAGHGRCARRSLPDTGGESAVFAGIGRVVVRHPVWVIVGLGGRRGRDHRLRPEAHVDRRRGVVPADALRVDPGDATSSRRRSRRPRRRRRSSSSNATTAAHSPTPTRRRSSDDRPGAVGAAHPERDRHRGGTGLGEQADPDRRGADAAADEPERQDPGRRRQGAAHRASGSAAGPPTSSPASPVPPRRALDSQASGDRANVIIGVATVGLILVLLLVIFRSPIIALLPIITIGVVSQIATGLIGWANSAFNLKTDSSVSAFLIVVLFGVGTDYILFLMFRYRERLRAGEDSKTAMISAVTRVGEAIASAAGAVIIAFLALTLSTLGLFKSLGPALAIAVATTLLAGLTLIPAVVSLLGTKVFWPSKAWKQRADRRPLRRDRRVARPPPRALRRRLRWRPGRPGRLRARLPPQLRPQRRLHLDRVRVDRLAEANCSRACRPAPPNRPTSTCSPPPQPAAGS